MKARLQGVKAVTLTFHFLFSCSLIKIILKQADDLSKTLQKPPISAAQGKEIVYLVTETLREGRCDEKFELFCSNLINKKTELDVGDPKLTHQRKLPDFYHFPSSHDSFYHGQPKGIYRQLYPETFDNINCVVLIRQITRYMCIFKRF